MLRMFVRVSAATLALCAACSSAPPTATASPAGGALKNFATITESASTNTPGIVIYVRADGVAHWEVGQLAGRGARQCRIDHGEVPVGPLADTLLADIPSDVRLADLPVGSCSKPASFRTTTTLDHFGDTSGDLSCPASDPRTVALARDVNAVKRAVLVSCG